MSWHTELLLSLVLLSSVPSEAKNVLLLLGKQEKEKQTVAKKISL